ncbi:MAG TPA: hypothetical protein VFC96_04840, partial [Anaerovoracaceae bacterium]|nr:hypothetical protein [Anaerovoracaceae bacterium]
NLMHLLTSYFFIFLIPLLYAVFNFYFQEFLYGFDLSGNWVDIALSISPYTGILNSGGYFSILEVLYYTGTILLMLVISAVLYNIRRLERASDSLTFNFMKPIICYVIAFLGMTMLGFYFQVLGEGRIYMYAGFAAGTVIFFIIGQMIVVKSPRIYNKEGLKSFLAYALIAVLFIAGLNFDLTGFEKRVPKPQNIKTAHISMPFSSSMRSNVGFDVESLTSKENVEALAKFHREILNNRHRFEEAENLYTSSLKINYDMKGLFDMSRRYEIDYNFWADSRELKEIFESAEYKEKNSLHTSKIEKFEKAYIYSEVSDDKNIEINNSRLLDELIANIEKDFQEMSYEDLVSPRPTYINIEFQYTYKVGERSDWGDGKGYISLGIWENAKNTIDWLRARNYGIELTADMVEWIDVYAPKYESGNNMAREKSMAMSEYDYSVKVEERPAIMQIKDKDKIEKILKTYDRFSINSDTSYEVSIAYKMNGSDYHYTNGYLNRTLDFLN